MKQIFVGIFVTLAQAKLSLTNRDTCSKWPIFAGGDQGNTSINSCFTVDDEN